MKPISPTLHGGLDYTFAGLAFLLPRAAGWRGRAARLMTAAAIGAVAYSLCTDYRLGAVKLLSMRAHLAADGVLNALLLAGALLPSDEDAAARRTLVALGLAGLAIVALTEPDPPAAGAPRAKPEAGAIVTDPLR